MIRAETQHTVAAWAEQTFGPAQSDLRVATRVHEELLELQNAVLAGLPDEKIREEAADVAICLYRLGAVLGADLDRRIQSALMMGMAKELVPENDSPARAVMRAELKLVVAKNMMADGFPRTRFLQEVTAVRVILEEVVTRHGGSLTDEVDAKMVINRNRVWRLDGSGHGYHVSSSAELTA
jgi:hypothetical protein